MEVTQAFCIAHLLAHPVNVAATLRRIGHIQDVIGVCAALVIIEK